MKNKTNEAKRQRNLEIREAFDDIHIRKPNYLTQIDKLFFYFQMGTKWEREKPKVLEFGTMDFKNQPVAFTIGDQIKNYLEYGKQFHESNKTISNMEQSKQELLIEELIKRKTIIEKAIEKLAITDNDAIELIVGIESNKVNLITYDLPAFQATMISLLNVRLMEIKKEIYSELYPENINVTDHP